MTPIVAIVGRPNVGKSTLFNRLTKTRQALVHDLPGVTRDRLYGKALLDEREVTLIDTGGFDPPADQAFADEVHSQVELAMAEADLIVFLTDGRAGLSPLDYEVADRLRRTAKPVILAVNKVDGPNQEDAAQEFHALGMAPIHFISSAHGYGIRDFGDEILAALPPAPPVPELDLETPVGDQAEDKPLGPVRVALLGRPNTGKSSLLNQLAGAERVVVSDVPGTTRDAVDTPLSRSGRDYLFIDTAGIRRQGRVERGLEKASVFRSLRALERCHLAVVLVDSSEGVTDQDLRVMGQAVENYRGLIVLLNKWDLLAGDKERQKELKAQVADGLRFAPWAPVIETSALTGKGVGRLWPAIDQVWREFNHRVATADLNRALEMLTERHTPPMFKGTRLKFFYASQVAVRPATVVIMVNRPAGVHFSYRRYLINGLREFMGLKAAPLRLFLRERSGRRPKSKAKAKGRGKRS